MAPFLVLNAGSSSLKFAVFRSPDGDGDPERLLAGQIAGIGLSDGAQSHGEALASVFDQLRDRGIGLADIAGIGHRIVHGGVKFTKPIRVSDDAIRELSELRSLAPHHLPQAIAAIEACTGLAPDIPQIGCFDTAFHATQSDIESRFALPEDYWQRGLRRYGFHGLSYEHVIHALPEMTGDPLPDRLIVFHLGNGASACAIKSGRSAGTTMGFSTVDGLVMGTRSGSIDPGLLIHLMRSDGLDADALEDLLYNRSGLLGLSGTSGDMRTLLSSDNPQSGMAIEKYCLAAARAAASLIPLIGGLDGIVFTGGIGENAPDVRGGILSRLDWLDLDLDMTANGANAAKLSGVSGGPAIWIVPANEELTIARHMKALLA